MGITYYSCNCCQEAFDEYKEYAHCNGCTRCYCGGCAEDCLIWVHDRSECTDCTRKFLTTPDSQELLELALEKLGKSRADLKKEYLATVTLEPLACGDCSTLKCSLIKDKRNGRQIEAEEEYCFEDKTVTSLGWCCRCVRPAKPSEWCESCANRKPEDSSEKGDDAREASGKRKAPEEETGAQDERDAKKAKGESAKE